MKLRTLAAALFAVTFFAPVQEAEAKQSRKIIASPRPDGGQAQGRPPRTRILIRPNIHEGGPLPEDIKNVFPIGPLPKGGIQRRARPVKKVFQLKLRMPGGFDLLVPISSDLN